MTDFTERVRSKVTLHIYHPNGSAETGKKSYSELQTFLKICSGKGKQKSLY